MHFSSNHVSRRPVVTFLTLAWLTTAFSMAQPGRALAEPLTPQFSTPGLHSASGPSIQAFAVADFNNDANNDIAVANLNGSLPEAGLPVLLGDGTGKFGAPVLTQLPGTNESATDVSPADFNSDGRQDLAVPTIIGSGINATAQLRILLGNGDGTFRIGTLISSSTDRAIASDVTGDGKADLVYVVNDASGPSIYVSFGRGDGTFQAATVYPPPFSISLEGLTVKDVNGDGGSDLVYLEGCPTVRLNDGTGRFGPEICSPDSQARLSGVTLAVDDFTSDGKQDLAIGDASGGHVTIAQGDGTGRFTFLKRYSNLAYQVLSVASADFTGDGKADLVASADPNWQGTESSFVFMVGLGTGSFTGFNQYASGGYGFIPAKLNLDRWIDLVSTDLISTGNAFVTLNDGRGNWHAPKVFTTSGLTSRVVNGDLNGDGPIDVAFPLAGSIEANLNQNNVKFGPARISAAPGSVYSLALADVSGDGKLDAVAGSTGPKNVLVMPGRGDGTFGSAYTFSAGGSGGVVSIAVSDVTGDGRKDIVAHTSTELSVLPGRAGGGFGAAILSGRAGGSSQAATVVADFTGDGMPDVVSAIMTGNNNAASSDVVLNAGNGDGTFMVVQTQRVLTNVTTGVSGDLNGDGTADLAIVGWKGSDGGLTGMYVFQAAGGSLATPSRYAAGSSGLALADFNHDGSMDAVVTCGSDPCPASASELATYANNGDGTFAGPFVLNTIYTPAGVTAADFSGDGRADIIEVIPQVSDSKFTQYTNTTP